MKKYLNVLALSLALMLLLGEAAMAQVQFRVPLYLAWGTKRDTIYVGVNGGNGSTIQPGTYGLDLVTTGNFGVLGLYGESGSPPPDADGNRVRFIDVNGRPEIGAQGGLFRYDFRSYTSPTQADTFAVEVTGLVVEGNDLTVTWGSASSLQQYASGWGLHARTGTSAGALLANMLTQTSYTFTFDGNPKRFIVVKTGALAPAPVVFSASPSPINFGTVNVGTPVPVTLTISNTGTSDPLSISSIELPVAPFIVSGGPATPFALNPGQSVQFSVTFNSAVAGTFRDTIFFTHNAAGSPAGVPLVGIASSNADKLYFGADSVTRMDKSMAVRDTLWLANSDTLKAIQFQIESKGLTILRSISKGPGLLDASKGFNSASWNFNSQIWRGPVDSSGASKDSIIVVIYGNGTTVLPPETYALAVFEYDVVNIDEPDTQQTSFELDNLVGSDQLGGSLGLSVDQPQIVTVLNRTMSGDVNDDGRVDILDLLLIVDHILGRIVLTGDSLDRADVVFPFPAGDDQVNALDLAAVQNMILTNRDPNQQPINKSLPVAGNESGADVPATLRKTDVVGAHVTIYTNETGVAVLVETQHRVKGLQFDLAKIQAIIPEARVQTILGQGYFDLNAEKRLRVLVYDSQGASLDAGKYILAHLDFPLSSPAALKVSDLILADQNNTEIENVEVTLSHEAPPELPVEFSLKQNYPNPFNPTTDIQFSVPQAGNVRITVYNMLGQEVRTLFFGEVERGSKIVRWDGRNNSDIVMPSGVYIYRMTAGSFVDAKKMMLLK
jgi:hypothetical protein